MHRREAVALYYLYYRDDTADNAGIVAQAASQCDLSIFEIP